VSCSHPPSLGNPTEYTIAEALKAKKATISNNSMAQLEKYHTKMVSQEIDSTVVESSKGFNLLQMGKDVVEFSSKLHDLSSGLTIPLLNGLETGLPDHYMLSPEETELYELNLYEIFAYSISNGPSGTHMTAQLSGLIEDQESESSSVGDPENINQHRRNEIHDAVLRLLNTKMMDAQTDWDLLLALQRRRQLARQEWEQAEIQAKAADYRYKVLLLATKLSTKYPYFRSFLTSDLTRKGVINHRMFPELSCIEPHNDAHSPEQRRKWTEDGTACPICLCGIFEGGISEPLASACSNITTCDMCYQPLHTECLTQYLLYPERELELFETPDLVAKRCPLCRTVIAKSYVTELLRRQTVRMLQMAEQFEF